MQPTASGTCPVTAKPKIRFTAWAQGLEEVARLHLTTLGPSALTGSGESGAQGFPRASLAPFNLSKPPAITPPTALCAGWSTLRPLPPLAPPG